MTITYKLLPDGGFVAGDTETRRTSYAYPTSTHATHARRSAKRVAAEMIEQANAFAGLPHVRAEYDARNWAKLG